MKKPELYSVMILMFISMIFCEFTSVNVQIPQDLKFLPEFPVATPKDSPLKITVSLTENALGFQVHLQMNGVLRAAGVYDIKFGSYFKECSTVFNIFVDMTDWPSIGKIYTTENSVEIPRLLLSDLGISPPFTTLSMTLDNLVMMPRGVSGRIRGDISIGISSLQWLATNLTFYTFELGVMDNCRRFKDSYTCREDVSCGWCSEKSLCLSSRQDHRSDVCKFCNRCTFFYDPKDVSKEECLQKNSCGWCDQSKTCYPGDELGPFDLKEKYCKTTLTNVTASEDWQYVTRKEDTEQGKVWGIGTGTFIGTALGVLMGSLGTLFVTAIISLILYHRNMRKTLENDNSGIAAVSGSGGDETSGLMTKI